MTAGVVGVEPKGRLRIATKFVNAKRYYANRAVRSTSSSCTVRWSWHH
jgi:hypothetical protein